MTTHDHYPLYHINPFSAKEDPPDISLTGDSNHTF